MKVVIYATAAVDGGALSVLNDLIEFIKFDTNNYTICINESLKNKLVESPNITYKIINSKGIFTRLKWDFFCFSRYFDNKYDAVVNLQNIPVRTKLKQIVLIHQPIPFSNIKLSLSLKHDFKLLFYKYAYGLLIKLMSKYMTHCLVQTEWMKQKVSEKIGVDNNIIHIVKPDVNVDFTSIIISANPNNIFIYPAAAYSYKNHIVLVKALREIGVDYLKKHNIKLYLTIEEDDFIYLKKYIIDNHLSDFVVFLGSISRNEVLNIIANSKAMLFPSMLETFGVPLIEAAKLNKQIIVSDLPYSREVLCGYKSVAFCGYSDCISWAANIKKCIEVSSNNNCNRFSYESGWTILSKVLKSFL